MLDRMSFRRAIALITALAVAASCAVAAAAGVERNQASTLTIYSGRDERFVQPLFDRFTKETGIEVRVRYGDSAALAATLIEEGRNSPADIFFAQDAGALGAVAARKQLRVLPTATLKKVAARFRAPDKRWIGISGRARVVAYNTDALTAARLPKTIWGYTGRQWRGKVAVPPTNASFQAFVSAMRMRAGEARTRDWLLAMKANDVKFYPSNSRILAAVASREVEVGLVNHYYLYQLKEQQPNAPVANAFLGKKDPGALINVAGVGLLSTTKNSRDAVRLVNFLLSRQSQHFFSRSPGRAEYPLASGVRPRPGLPPLRSIEGAKINLARLGRELPKTLELLNEVGYTR